MSEVKHTRGLLEVRRAKDAGIGDCAIVSTATNADDGNPAIIAEVFSDIRLPLEFASDEAQANARRLVACWNAFEGISTEQIERLGISMVCSAVFARATGAAS